MPAPSDGESARRPIASRNLKVSGWAAAWLYKLGVAPNAISVTSVVFALGAGLSFELTSRLDPQWGRLAFLSAAVLILLRLLANLFDGMVAVEFERKSPVGELYNEVPDRISDPAILIGAGHAAGGDPVLGYLAAVVALFVAYVRSFGASVGAGQLFIGPMAKQQRMFVLIVISLYSAATPISWQPMDPATGRGVTAGALALIVVVGVLTAVRRLRRIASALRRPTDVAR